jgi:hypothetical protein
MPGFTGKLGAQAVRQWSESRRSHLDDVLVREHPSTFALLVTINARA